MNMAANSDKMAVTDNQPSIPVHSSDSREDSEINKNQGKPLVDGNFKKKGTFKITSITKSYHGPDMSNDTEQEMEHDSLDDLDETVESHTEDASSEILDISKHTDGGEQASPMEEETSDHAIHVNTHTTAHKTDLSSGVHTVNKPEQSSNGSTNVKSEQSSVIKEKPEQQGPHPTRFKVVKIETREPFKRGRWRCHDTSDFPAPEKSDSKIYIPDSNTSGMNSIHNVGAVDDPSKNPAKSANVIQGESHIDNSMIRQSTNVVQPQTHSSNLQSNIAQSSQTHHIPSSFHNGTGHSQMVNSYAPGMSTMQTGDTTFVHAGQILSTIQKGTGFVDKNVHYSSEHKDNVIQDTKDLDSNKSRAMGANVHQDSGNADVQQGAILTPQSVAEVVGMIPSPQEEDRYVYRASYFFFFSFQFYEFHF